MYTRLMYTVGLGVTVCDNVVWTSCVDGKQRVS